MAKYQVKSYGSWKTPITSELIVSGTIKLGDIVLAGEDILWGESRPAESGRNVIVRRDSEGKIQGLTPKVYNVRTRVHEYGGGSFAASASSPFPTSTTSVSTSKLSTLNLKPLLQRVDCAMPTVWWTNLDSG